MKLINFTIADLNYAMIFMVALFVAMAILMICNFNASRTKIKNIQINRL